MKIELELDLGQYLARHVGYDEDGQPVQEPTTLEDVVIGMVAQRLQQTIITKESKQYLFDKVRAIRDEEIREQVRPMIAEALTKAIQPTDVFGCAKGGPTTLAEVIVAEATRQLKPSRDSYSRSKGIVEDMIATAVSATFKAELAKELEAGKEAVRKALRDQGAALIEQAIEKAAAGR